MTRRRFKVNDTERQRVAFHEAGHQFAAYELGVALGPSSIACAAEHTNGWASHNGPWAPRDELGHIGKPAVLLPARLRRAVEARIIILLAGRTAEALRPDREPAGYGPAVTEDEREAGRLAAGLEALGPAERARHDAIERRYAAMTSEEAAASGDWARATSLAVGLSGSVADAHMHYLAALTFDLLFNPRAARMVTVVAEALLRDEVLSARKTRALLREADSFATRKE